MKILKYIKRVVGIFLWVLIAQPLLAQEKSTKYNVGLLVVATGKYIQFVEPLLISAQKHFCSNHNVTYFIFTDGVAPQWDNVVSIEQKRLGWPYDTMMRFDMYARAEEKLKNMDYVFACDADMLFVDTVGDEIFGDRVATLHPGYVGGKGTYETRSISTAYIPQDQGSCYFAGGFNGGKTQEFLKMANTITNNIKIDLDNGVVAVWHDESHLNRYYVDYVPTVILSPSYCYWEGHRSPYPEKLVALTKDHTKFRS